MQALITFFTHIVTVLLAQGTFCHWSWCWVMSFVVKSYFIWNGETWTWSGDFIVSFHQCNLNNSSAELHFWSPFGFVHNWCNRQQYTNPRLSACMIKIVLDLTRHNLLNQRLPYICCMLWWHEVAIRLHFPCLVFIDLHFLPAQHSQHCYQSLQHCCSIESVQSDHLM